MGLLSDTACRNAKPRDKAYRLADGDGLMLEVRTTGKRYWRLRYRLHDKEQMYALGEYPAMSLKAARDAAMAARKQVADGVNLTQARTLERQRKAREAASTFEAVSEEWQTKMAADWSPNYKRQVRQRLGADAYPALAARPMNEIKPVEILSVLQTVEKRSRTQAKLLKISLNTLFQYAVASMLSDSNPVAAIGRQALKAPVIEHHKALTLDEIPIFFTGLNAAKNGPIARAAARLLWLTVVRAGELIGAQWDEIDWEERTWTVPAERVKGRRGYQRMHVVPLSTQAIEAFAALRQLTGNGAYVFPARYGTRPMSYDSVRDAFEAAGIEGFTPHGVRGTFSTSCHEAGHNSDVIERCLAHVEPNMVKRSYNHARLMDERRTLMQTWADLIERLCAGGAQVVPLRRSA